MVCLLDTVMKGGVELCNEGKQGCVMKERVGLCNEGEQSCVMKGSGRAR